MMTDISFTKMHGIGNDFVVIDTRHHAMSLSNEHITFLCDRHKGIGCDQLVLMETSNDADCFVRFFNPDGSESGACGNASRCIAHRLMVETNRTHVTLRTHAGLLDCTRHSTDAVTVNMGKAKTLWHDIPLAKEVDIMHLPIISGELSDGVAVNMGNPHAVFFVADTDAIDLATHGKILEHDALFPERANINVAHIVARNRINLRVWERGAGETLACGSGACATVVAAILRGFTQSKVDVSLAGGTLTIEVHENGAVYMTGPVATVFEGTVTL